jgi:predicted heme/steroid binding protein
MELTRSELKKYNGTDNEKIYIAYKGKIYDVTDSDLWMGGEHQGLHEAGNNLTEELDEAPHGDEELEIFDVVGTLKD